MLKKLVALLTILILYFCVINQGNIWTMETREYGQWKSPITAEKAAGGSLRLSDLLVDGEHLYWTEGRPDNKGRNTLVRWDRKGKKEDLTPPDFNVRDAVHEYGGGSFTVKDGVIIASNFADHKLYIKRLNDTQFAPLTKGQVKEQGKWIGSRFADLHLTHHGIIAIGEEHRHKGEPENFLALIDLQTGDFQKIASGYDFYSSPAINAEGNKIAYICWNHPEMPWTHSELWVADIREDGTLSNQKMIAGETPESVFQPEWSSNGDLYFVSDRNEWWNLYRYRKGTIEPVLEMEAEIGLPNWVFGQSTWTFLGDNILFTHIKDGFSHLGLFDPNTGKWKEVSIDGVRYAYLRSGTSFACFIEGHADTPERIVWLEKDSLQPQQLELTEEETFATGYLSKPSHITFKSANDRNAYGYYYPPVNKDYKGTKEAKPPLIVMIHGGPTSKAQPVFKLGVQFWTSRGFAVLDVDYGGSTGYGRTYRMLLNGQCGVVDVEDCVYGADHLVKKGLVDPNKLFIRGGSAGGYVALCALTHDRTFKGGADYYGIADLTALAHDTHKFEARYLDSLLGPYPDAKDLWEERSPIHHMDKFESPLIIFQGTDDAIVPPNQSEMIFEALQKKGIKTEIHLYEGEQHGFRKKENIANSLDKEYAFYLDIMCQQ